MSHSKEEKSPHLAWNRDSLQWEPSLVVSYWRESNLRTLSHLHTDSERITLWKKIKLVSTKECDISAWNTLFSLVVLVIYNCQWLPGSGGRRKQISNKDSFSHPSFKVFSLASNGEESVLSQSHCGESVSGKTKQDLEDALDDGDLRPYVFLQAATKARLEEKRTKHGCEFLSFIYLLNKYVLSIVQSAHIPGME